MLKYDDKNPVDFVNNATLLEEAERLGTSIGSWMGDYEDPSTKGYVSRAGEILGYMEKPKNMGCIGGVYKFGGATIGVVQVKLGDDALVIENIVTHPAYSGAGAALIEFVVRLAAMNGYDGRVRLYAASPEAAASYVAMGFMQDRAQDEAASRGHMHLFASANAMWEPKEIETEDVGTVTNFVLKRYVGKKYATGFV